MLPSLTCTSLFLAVAAVVSGNSNAEVFVKYYKIDKSHRQFFSVFPFEGERGVLSKKRYVCELLASVLIVILAILTKPIINP